MKRSKRYIPVLITLALLSLICLQIVWLFFVYKYKTQELMDKTREAVLETTKRLQKEEDSKLILNNIDSLLVNDNIIGSDSKEEIRVIVSNIKNKLKIDTIRGNRRTHIEKKVRIIGDSVSSTTIYKIAEGSSPDVAVQSATYNKGKIKKKAGDLKSLFLKMAINAQNAHKNLSSRVDFKKVLKILKVELLKQGIDLNPEVGISFIPKDNKPNAIDMYTVFNTPGFYDAPFEIALLPLFPDDIFNGNAFISVSFKSTTNFVVKQMAGLLSLSLFITILIGFVMIYLFRRMLSQEKLHQLKNDFINNMTHELKTPIATISLALEGINNPAIKNDDEKFNNYSAILKEENKKLNDHVERVLQMALLDKGELVLDKKQINLKPILESCINAYQLQIQNKKAKLNFDCDVERIFVTGDEFHLLSAFNNLLDNALKYSGDNSEITVSLDIVGDHAEICFKDNGIGIDKNLQEKVFEKFYRVQGGNLHDVKGFGLGLSYVKSIIEAHGGTIELKSEKNNGSEFIIKLKAYAA